MRSLANSFAGTSIQRRKSEPICNTMKKIFPMLAIVPLALSAAGAATEQEIVDHSASIIREFRALPEHQIPPRVLRHARGLAVMSVVKAGFIFSGKGGHGVVVARTKHGWSGPSFIGTGGAGWGLQIGAQVTDFVIVLNNDSAVRAFSRGGNVTIGADVSAAAGPVGRTAEGAVAPTAAVFTYSRSKGVFAGGVPEGGVVRTPKGFNSPYYGRPVRADEIQIGRASCRERG